MLFDQNDHIACDFVFESREAAMAHRLGQAKLEKRKILQRGTVCKLKYAEHKFKLDHRIQFSVVSTNTRVFVNNEGEDEIATERLNS